MTFKRMDFQKKYRLKFIFLTVMLIGCGLPGHCYGGTKEMKAIIVAKPGDASNLSLLSRPLPIPGPDEILINVKAAGINRADIEQRQGEYPPPEGASEILGLEVSGIVVKVGKNVKSFKVGDRVMALISGGGYAEFAVAHQNTTFQIPSPLTFIEAAAIPEAYFTLWSTIFEKGHLNPGEIILIHGGSGGIGTAAIQLANYFGATVITTTRLSKREYCLSLGANLVINYQDEDFESIVKEFTQNHGVDVILDIVGGDYFDKNLKILARNGRLVMIDCQNGCTVSTDITPIITKNLTLSGSVLRPRPISEKTDIAFKIKEKLLPILENGFIKPVIYKTFAIEQAQDAHLLFEKGQHMGKIILTFNE